VDDTSSAELYIRCNQELAAAFIIEKDDESNGPYKPVEKSHLSYDRKDSK
jgi:hypothetical protein